MFGWITLGTIGYLTIGAFKARFNAVNDAFPMEPSVMWCIIYLWPILLMLETFRTLHKTIYEMIVPKGKRL